MSLAGFLLVVLAGALLAYAGRRAMAGSGGPGRAVLGATAACMFGCLGVILIVSESPHWHGSTEIAWLAIESREPGGLVIGGPRSEKSIGWPQGHFWPRLVASPQDTAIVRLTVTGGRGFLFTDDGVLNGAALAEGKVLPVGAFSLRRQPQWLGLMGDRLDVLSSDGRSIASFDVRRAVFGPKRRVVAFEPLLRHELFRLRASRAAGDVRMAGAIESWADNLVLFVKGSRDFHVLSPADSSSILVRAGQRVSLLWPGRQRQDFTVRATRDGRTRLELSAPWRLTSPIPPTDFSLAVAEEQKRWFWPPRREERDRDRLRVLTVTAEVLPGDVAFRIPLGGDLDQVRVSVPIKGNRFLTSAPPRFRGPQPLPPRARPPQQEVTSRQPVELGSWIVELATVRDLPRPWIVLACLAVAVIMIGFGFAQLGRRMPIADTWTIAATGATVFLLLLVRFILAYRYALEPAFLDDLSVRGVVGSLMALVAVPGLVMLSARLWRDGSFDFDPDDKGVGRRRAGMGVMRYTLLLFAAIWIERWLAIQLRPNFQVDLFPRDWGQAVVHLALCGLFLGILVHVHHLYPSPRASRGRRGRLLRLVAGDPERGHRGLVGTMHRFAMEGGQRFWSQIGYTERDEDLGDPEAAMRGRYGFRLGLALAVLGVFFVALFFGSSLIPPQVKFLPEVGVPLLLCWIPAVILLASRQRFYPGARVVRFAWLRFVTLVLGAAVALFLLPFTLHDAGSLVGVIAIFVPVALVMFMAARPLRVAGAVMLVLLLSVCGAAYTYLNLRPLLPTVSHLGQIGVRLLVFKEGLKLQEEMPLYPLLDQGSAVTSTELAQGLQHTWENQAIAHEGRWLGLGYGRAPTRQSQVRQDTIQFDSTFSFFILSEFGIFGGLGLLLLYGVPLVLVLASGRRRFDVGHGLAAVIAASLLLEALSHAGMNLGMIPFTGRDLPLLAVNSTTDLIRWAVLLGLMAQALVWRPGLGASRWGDATSIVTTPEGAAASVVPGSLQERWSRLWRRGGSVAADSAAEVVGTRRLMPALPRQVVEADEPSEPYRLGTRWLRWPAAAAIALVVLSSVRAVVDRSLSNPFDWSGLLRTVSEFAGTNQIRFDPVRRELVPDTLLRRSGGTLLEQEIARFNALRDDEKLEGPRSRSVEELRVLLGRVASVANYDRVMDALRENSDREEAPRRAMLFRLLPPIAWADEEETIPAESAPYRIAPNASFNTRVSFHPRGSARELPCITYRDGARGGFEIRGNGTQFTIEERDALPGEERTILLEARPGNSLARIRDTNAGGPRGSIFIRGIPRGSSSRSQALFGQFEVRHGRLEFSRGPLYSHLIRGPNGQKKVLLRDERVTLRIGDVIELTADTIFTDLHLALTVGRSYRGAIVGPAWVMGRWMTAVDPDGLVPWASQLLGASEAEWERLGHVNAGARYGQLTLDRGLQAAAQEFVARKGRALHAELLPPVRWQDAVPPRVALAVVDLAEGRARGSVRALGAWPRMTPDRHWRRAADGERLPPGSWVETEAPRSLRLRYAGDRNFDRLVAGSATKPLWAAATLASLDESLASKLAVRGPAEEEEDAFGIPIRPSWKVGPSASLAGGAWTDFDSYLARSDNRYQVRLGLLGLAQEDIDMPGHVAIHDDSSGSTRESMDGGQTVWGKTPEFTPEVEFGRNLTNSMAHLEETDLARNLQGMFAIGTRHGEVTYRTSFWSGDETDDWPDATSDSLPRQHRPSSLVDVISPEAPDFELDLIRRPRDYVTLLLGGGTNLWSNVDLAGAFGAIVSGRPVVPHIAAGPEVRPAEFRTSIQVAKRLRRGLNQTVMSPVGTAREGGFAQAGGLGVITRLGKDYTVYAKTGTLATSRASRANSRLLLAIVRWRGDEVEHGLVFSIVGERAAQGTTSRWLGEFLAENESQIRELLAVRP